MNRTYFNGVGNISSNGTVLSFVFDDTYQSAGAGAKKNPVIELITELDTAEGICKYLLAEINKIKALNKPDTLKVSEDINVVDKEPKLKLGLKIASSKPDH